MNLTVNRSGIQLLLLVIALIVVLWLADTLEYGLSPFSQQVEITPPEGATLTFSPSAGAYSLNQLISIVSPHPDAQIIFTTGGAIPTLAVGTLYERPLFLDASFPGVAAVRAREAVNGTIGPVVSVSYAIGIENTLPILSIIADPPDLWDVERGILANPWQRGREWERPVHVTYFGGKGGLEFEISAGLRVNGSEPFDVPKQSLRLYFRNAYGTARLDHPLFSEHPHQEIQSFNRLLLQAGDKPGRWTLLGEQLVSDVATDIGRFATQGNFALLFLNGNPWGIYRLSERFDRFFLQDDFGIRSADLIRDGNIEEGDDQHWNALMDWLIAHNLADQDNYTYIQTQIDVDDFVDYVILQTYFGLPTDRFSAARPRVGGGRWFWLYGNNGTGITRQEDMGSSLLRKSQAAGDLADLSLLLHSLLENSSFRAKLASRTADLLNTTLAPEAMSARIDRLAAQLRPDIEYEIDRWPSQTHWEQNIAALRDLVRHRGEAVQQQLATTLDLRGTASLRLESTSIDGGFIFVDGILTPGFPWTGHYFLDTDVQVIAVPASDHVFAGWTGERMDTSSPIITFTVAGPRILTADFYPAPTDDFSVRPNDLVINEYRINDVGTRYTSVGNRPIEGDWLELLVTRSGGFDLRGWRITDNNTKTGIEEGSIILPWLDALVAVPRGTVILIITTETPANAVNFALDDLTPGDGRMIFYVGNGNLDVTTDSGFGIGTNNDNLVVLAPGPSSTFGDDIGVDFVAEGDTVTPISFGVLADGVRFESPFRGLGAGDGVHFASDQANNDQGHSGWIVAPSADRSRDGTSLDGVNTMTPGAPNYRSAKSKLQDNRLWVSVIALAFIALAVCLHTTRHQPPARKTTGR